MDRALDNMDEPTINLVDWDLKDTNEIIPDWVPYTNWLRFRFDNDGVIIVTNLNTGSSIFMNTTAGLILKLCMGKYNIGEIAKGIAKKFLDQDEEAILEDVKGVILENFKIGNLVLARQKFKST